MVHLFYRRLLVLLLSLLGRLDRLLAESGDGRERERDRTDGQGDQGIGRTDECVFAKGGRGQEMKEGREAGSQ